ncbi:BatA domain-containing protein [Planctomyces sp. SH-PL14]|uniref:BatA domain-containing protein n=1 Tax=Planctomyces sp. SH-PL14 TaxID=1632864 RepID=UPI00094648A6|nr:BatA domain-containing protein [Planctomyces sp. SH-PL14]
MFRLPASLAFGFGSPWMLWGLLAIGIPILIHLLRQRRPRVVPWGAMRFVRAALEKRQRQIRIDSWLQVLIRGLLLACLAFALAEPYLERLGLGTVAESATHRIVVVDSSYSMGYRSGGETSFERAQRVARQIVEASRTGDSFHLARISGQTPRVVIRRPSHDPADVLQEIDRLPLLEERGDLLNSLKPLPPLLAAEDHLKSAEVVFATDLQQENWLPSASFVRSQCGELFRQLGKSAEVSLVDVGAAVTENAAVVGLESRRPIAAPGAVLDLDVEVKNFGRSPRPGTVLEIAVEGVVRHRESIDLPGSGTVRRSVRVPSDLAQDALVEARIEEDPLPLDNVRRLIVPLRREVRTLVVAGSESAESDAEFVRLALAPAETLTTSPPAARLEIRPEVISLGGLRDRDLEAFDSVILCDVPALTEGELDRLRRFVTSGGGLILALGEKASAADYAQGLGADLLPAPFGPPTPPLTEQDRPFSFSETDSLHPLLRVFAGNPDAGLLTTPIFRYRPIEGPEPPAGTEVILRLSNGAPVLLERRSGNGRVLQIQTALNDEWGSWVLWPSFLPMMHEIVLASIRGELAQRVGEVGETLSGPRIRGAAEQCVLTRPDGSRSTITASGDIGSRVDAGRGDVCGVYQFSFPGGTRQPERYVVNCDTRESALARVSPETLRTELGLDPAVRFTTQWTPPVRETGATTGGGEIGRMVQPLLGLTLVLLVLDLLVAGWKRSGAVPGTQSGASRGR